jgi:glycosyltransferase involved in cell wall biosynthesis
LKLLDLLYSFRARAALPKHSDVIVTNTFWLPMLLRNAARGQVYVHVARFPKGQMRYYAHCARLQAPSRAVAEAVTQQAPELASKVTAIPYPRPEPIDPSTPPPLQNRPATILYVGRVHPEKGVHLLVEAFTRLPLALTVSWKLRIVGPWESYLGGGGEAYRDQLLRQAKGADAVQLHGSIFDAGELEREFRNARVFVYPSLAETGETFGLAPLEAMTHGCAVVVSNLGCFHDFIVDDETGFIFDHRAEAPTAALELKLAALLNNEARLAAVAERGRAQTEEYSLPAVASKYLADFQLLTDAPVAAR